MTPRDAHRQAVTLALVGLVIVTYVCHLGWTPTTTAAPGR
jgi:hypothetical protein